MEAKGPFEIIFDAQLKDLSKYRAVILPDQESLSEPQMDLIREYVRSGGSVEFTVPRVGTYAIAVIDLQ